MFSHLVIESKYQTARWQSIKKWESTKYECIHILPISSRNSRIFLGKQQKKKKEIKTETQMLVVATKSEKNERKITVNWGKLFKLCSNALSAFCRIAWGVSIGISFTCIKRILAANSLALLVAPNKRTNKCNKRDDRSHKTVTWTENQQMPKPAVPNVTKPNRNQTELNRREPPNQINARKWQ